MIEAVRIKEEKLNKDLKNSTISKVFKKETELVKFLFKSEETIEWIVGAKVLGERAVRGENKKEYKDMISYNLKTGEAKNLHALRHSMLALLSYLTETIKEKGIEEKFDIIYEKEEIFPSDFFLEIFKNFEIAGFIEGFKNISDAKEILHGNMSRILKIAEEHGYLKKRKEKIENEIDKKTQLLANKKKAPVDKQKGIEKIEELLGKFKKDEKILLQILEKREIFYDEEIELIGDIFKKEGRAGIDEFFKKFEGWVIGSIYFAVPEFFEAIEEDEYKEKFEFLSRLPLLTGMIFYNTEGSAEYFKNGIYILQKLMENKNLNNRYNFKVLLPYLEKKYCIHLKVIKDKYKEHFVATLSEISLIYNKKCPLDIIKEYNLIEEKIPEKNLRELFLCIYKRLMEAISTPDIFSTRVKSLKDEEILFSLTSWENIKYEYREKCLLSMLFASIKNEKKFVPFLLRELKVLFYKKLQDVFYFNRGNINFKDIDRELIKQLFTGYTIIKEWSLPGQAVKELATMFSNILQTSYLLDKTTEGNTGSFIEKYYTIFYVIPDKKVFQEIKNYISISELDDLFEIIINHINKPEMPSEKEFEQYFRLLEEKIGINFGEIFKNIMKSSELDNKGKDILHGFISGKEKFKKLEDEDIEILEDERGEELLDNYIDLKVTDEIEVIEDIMKNRAYFLETITGGENLCIEGTEKTLEDDIKNLKNLKKWSSKNLPYIEGKYANIEIEKQEKKEKELYYAVKKADEKKILRYYSDSHFAEYHSFIEKWLSKRLLFTEILEETKKRNTNTMIGRSKYTGIFSFAYKFITNPYIVFSMILLPYICYFSGVDTGGRYIFSFYISVINFLVPAIAIIVSVWFIYNFIIPKKKTKETPPTGILFIEFFLPKLFGMITIAVLSIIVADETWASNFGYGLLGFCSIVIFFIIIALFVEGSIIENIKNIEDTGLLAKSSISHRAWRVLSTGFLEAYILVLFYTRILSEVMINRGSGPITISHVGNKVLGIPKIVEALPIWVPAMDIPPVMKLNISFTPFFLLTILIIVVFTGVVLNLFLNRDKIL